MPPPRCARVPADRGGSASDGRDGGARLSRDQARPGRNRPPGSRRATEVRLQWWERLAGTNRKDGNERLCLHLALKPARPTARGTA